VMRTDVAGELQRLLCPLFPVGSWLRWRESGAINCSA
jgi:hypothetical protein